MTRVVRGAADTPRLRRSDGNLTSRRPKAEDDEQLDAFFDQLSFCDVADVLRFVNKECQFLSALTPLQPRYPSRSPTRTACWRSSRRKP